MGSLSSVSAGDDIVSSNINQFVDAMNGQGNYPISHTGVNDPALFALDVMNAEAGNGRTFRARDSSGGARIQVDINGVTVNQLIASSGSIIGSTFSAGLIKTSTMSMLAASSNVVQVPQARVYHASTQTLTANAITVLTFNQERWDNDGLHSTTTSPTRLTPSRAGLWGVGGTINVTLSSTAAIHELAVRLNGATQIAAQRLSPSSTPVTINLNVNTEYQLSTSDYAELLFNNTNAVGAQEASSGTGTEFWMSYRGAT